MAVVFFVIPPQILPASAITHGTPLSVSSRAARIPEIPPPMMRTSVEIAALSIGYCPKLPYQIDERVIFSKTLLLCNGLPKTRSRQPFL